MSSCFKDILMRAIRNITFKYESAHSFDRMQHEDGTKATWTSWFHTERYSVWNNASFSQEG